MLYMYTCTPDLLCLLLQVTEMTEKNNLSIQAFYPLFKAVKIWTTEVFKYSLILYTVLLINVFFQLIVPNKVFCVLCSTTKNQLIQHYME